ncbi:MAG: hypothetical protein ACC630_07005, partial [Nitrospinota bacterium]
MFLRGYRQRETLSLKLLYNTFLREFQCCFHCKKRENEVNNMSITARQVKHPYIAVIKKTGSMKKISGSPLEKKLGKIKDIYR